jgi:methionyl-tRNA synthetase
MFCQRRRFLNAFRPVIRVTHRLSSSLPTDAKPYYVTTPIFYPNSGVSSLRSPSFVSDQEFVLAAVPHIGHLYSLVTADIFARSHRLANPSRPVQFVTGTDEHGLKIQRTAHGVSREPQEFCDGLSAEFQVCVRYAVNFLLHSS